MIHVHIQSKQRTERYPEVADLPAWLPMSGVPSVGQGIEIDGITWTVDEVAWVRWANPHSDGDWNPLLMVSV